MTVMKKPNHVMDRGRWKRGGFAVAEGFEEMNLLTEHSRKNLAGVEGQIFLQLAPGD